MLSVDEGKAYQENRYPISHRFWSIPPQALAGKLTGAEVSLYENFAEMPHRRWCADEAIPQAAREKWTAHDSLHHSSEVDPRTALVTTTPGAHSYPPSEGDPQVALVMARRFCQWKCPWGVCRELLQERFPQYYRPTNFSSGDHVLVLAMFGLSSQVKTLYEDGHGLA